MPTLKFMIIAIFGTLLALGFLYAYIIYLRPWEKTWLEVVAGVGFTILGEMALIGVTLWHFDLMAQLLPMIFIPPACYITTGVSQIFWQEKKHREGRKRAKWTLEKFNNKEFEE
jgi:hypothetical protein